jgi:hypothetical protein
MITHSARKVTQGEEERERKKLGTQGPIINFLPVYIRIQR